MKKLFALTLIFALILTAAACKKPPVDGPGKADMVALITDYGDITDAAYNQTVYAVCKAVCAEQNAPFAYFKPAADTDEDRAAAIRQAIGEGYNILVLPGKRFASPVAETAPENPAIRFIALDLAAGDYPEGADLQNVYSASYCEEQAGFLAGSAAVRLGYRQLGFLGATDDDATVRYGYGFIRGAEAAAEELRCRIAVNYVYAGQTFGDRAITGAMDRWFGGGTEALFVCGETLDVSAGEAAKEGGGKLIGADTDRKPAYDAKYGEGITVASAEKNLGLTARSVLADLLANGAWANYAGKAERFGVTGEEPAENGVRLSESTQWSESFTEEDYRALLRALADGTVTVPDDPEDQPETRFAEVDYQGTIK